MHNSIKILLAGAIVSGVVVVGLIQQGNPRADNSAPVAPVPTTARLRVVAANSVLCDLTRQVGGDRVDLVCLIPAGQDPHDFRPSASDARAIEAAQVVFYGGFNFEEGLTKLLKNSPGQTVAVAEVAIPDPLMVAGGHSHDHDPSKKEALAPDPHVWHSARNGINMVQTIAAQLSKADPKQAEFYRQNANTITTELQKLDVWIGAQIATIPSDRRKLVTTHNALGYYGQAYGIPLQSALVGISTNEQATPSRIGELVRDIRSAGVPTIFAELTANPKLIRAVAQEAQVKIAEQPLLADGLGELGQAGDTYQKMLIHNTQTIVAGLGGQFTPFQP